MRKAYLLLLLLNALFAEIQNVEFVAANVEKNGDIINAQGDVLVYSQRYLITSDKASYNTTSGNLELFGSINVLRGTQEVLRSEYALINVEEDIGDFAPFFFFNQESDLWFKCEEAKGDPEYYLTKKSIVSSCNIENPDWKIGFSSGKLNKESSFLHLYNSVFYIKDFPILYLPYFAFPTDNTRRTGLLRPEFGYNKDEGVLYRQPLYFAPHEWWDLELDPQIRVQRGLGLYSTFRFVDSAYSTGYITAGLFSEKDRYVKKEDLKNSRHYGYEVFYDRSSIFGSGLDRNGLEDGLRVDIKYLNDIDYLNLKKDSIFYDRLVTSKLNYFLRNEKNYLGVYAKYFIDTDTSNNDDTLQELPTLHYHKFMDSFLINNLQYSIDTQYHNYYRKEGLRAQQLELNVPITLYFSLFDEVLRFSLSENIYFMRANYDSFESHHLPYNFGQYFRNYHKLSIYTDLAKPYETFFHKMYLGVDYIVPSFDKKTGYLPMESFVRINTEIEQLTFNFKQYFYDKNGKKRVVHSIKQPYYFDEYSDKFRPIENKIEIYFPYSLTFNNELHYSYETSNIIKALSQLTWNNEKHYLSFSHTYDHELKNNFLSAQYEYNLLKNEKIFGGIDYDFKTNFMKSWNVGFKQARKCWDYSIVYKENVTPKLTSSGRASSVNKRGVYLMFNLYPLGGIQHEFSRESSKIL